MATAFSPDSKWLIIGSEDNTAAIYSTGNFEEPYKVIERKGYVYATAFSPDSKWLIIGSED